MKDRLYIKILLVLGILAGLSFLSACQKTKKNQEPNLNKEMGMTTTTYRTIYGNSHRGSFINVVSDARGHLSWEKELNFGVNQVPKSLLIWSGQIVVDTLSGIHLFDPSGNKSWEKPKNYGSFTVVGNRDVFYQDEYYGLNAVSIQNKFSLEDSYFPGAINQEFRVALFYPDKDDYISVVQHMPNNNEEEPFLQVIKAGYEERLPKWVERSGGVQHLPPLYVPELDYIVVNMNDSLAIYDGSEGNEVAKFQLPQIDYINWSADAQGNIFLIGNGVHPGESLPRGVLIAIDPNGKQIWAWSNGRNLNWLKKQPPVTGTKRNIYVFDSSYVYALNSGNLLWEYKILEGSPEYGTALADGSLLLAAGKKLIRLGPDGKELFVVSLDDEIVVPPVVDAEGDIYIATTTKLVKVQ